jgi:hypothetical protein
MIEIFDISLMGATLLRNSLGKFTPKKTSSEKLLWG